MQKKSCMHGIPGKSGIPGKYGIIVWFIATLYVIYSFSLNTAAAVFSNSIKTTLNASDFAVSIATGAFILGFACMQIPGGHLLDKFNARWVMSASVLILAIGNQLISLSDHVATYALSNFLQGAGASVSFIGTGVLIFQWYGDRVFPVLFGLTQTFSCISAGIIHFYLSLALTNHTWNEIYSLLALVGFVIFILSLLLVKSPPDYQRETNISIIDSLRIILKSKQIWLCSIACATSFGILLVYADFWYLPVQNYYSVGDLQSVIISGMIFAGLGIGTPIMGFLSNVVKSRRMIVHLTVCIGTMLLLLGLYLPRFDFKYLIVTKIISFLIGFFLSGTMLYYTMVSEVATNKTRGVALSILNTTVFLFNTLMLFIPYLFVTAHSKEFFTYLWILPFSLMFSLFLLYFIKETYPKK